MLKYLVVLLTVLQMIYSLPAHIHRSPISVAANYQIYANLYFGSQGKKIDLLLDTGSRTLATFCDLCQHGCIKEEEYMTAQSKAFKEIHCNNVEQFNNISPALRRCSKSCQKEASITNSTCTGDLAYGSSDLSSFLDYYLIYDEIRITHNSQPALSSFGCIYNQKNFQSGIWGLALDTDNQLLDSIYNNDVAKGLTDAKKLFSICLQGHKGILFIGGVDSSIHIGQGFKIRAIEQYGLWWNLDQRDIGAIRFGDKIIRDKQTFGRDNIILDSGTDVNILPSIMVKRIQTQVEKICEQATTNCVKADQYDVFTHVYVIKDAQIFFNNSAKITLEINGRILDTPLSNYFWNLGKDKWALALISRQKFHFQMSILGSIFMNNFDIQFNRHDNEITIYDISACSSHARLLQTQSQGQVDPDEYILPHQRQSVNTLEHLEKIKVKYQKSYNQLMKQATNGK